MKRVQLQAFVSQVERQLRRFPKLYQFASRTLYKFDRSFYTLSQGMPEAMKKAMQIAHDRGVTQDRDYYEFGVFRGFGLYCAHNCARAIGADTMHFYGFDSFRGLPQVEEIDRDGSMFFEGQFACSKDFVTKSLTKHGVDMDRVTLVEGYFEDSLTSTLKSRHPLKPVSIALIDCDLYTSTEVVLRWLDDLVRDGTIFMMDDWYAFGDAADKGQRRAFHEFLERRPDIQVKPLFTFEPHGSAFLLEIPSQR